MCSLATGESAQTWVRIALRCISTVRFIAVIAGEPTHVDMQMYLLYTYVISEDALMKLHGMIWKCITDLLYGVL